MKRPAYCLRNMAWSCSSTSNTGLVTNLKNQGIIRNRYVVDALQQVDRANFVKTTSPYDDISQYIGYRQTIPAPHMHAYTLENLAPAIMTNNARILDIGVGSGYMSAAMAKMNPTATVYGIDINPELVQLSYENIQKQHNDLFSSKRIHLHVADGLKGYLDGAPYDAIHVGGGTEKLPPELLRQLNIGGSMIIPVGSWMQDLLLVFRLGLGLKEWTYDLHSDLDMENDFHIRRLLSVRYEPLQHPNDFISS